MEQNLDNTFFITYSNHFRIGNKTFAFRKKQLFDISDTPKLMLLKNNNNCLGYWINRSWFALSKLKPLVKLEPITKDLSELQWYVQINLDQAITHQ